LQASPAFGFGQFRAAAKGLATPLSAGVMRTRVELSSEHRRSPNRGEKQDHWLNKT
jgi:hypothetical protein